MSYKFAVVGATGNVGREILQVLAEHEVPADDVAALASSRSNGVRVSYGLEAELKVSDLENFDFSGTDIVLSSAGSKVSAAFAPIAAAAGAVVIDNTSQFRMDPDVPLVVPEVNSEALADYRERNIIANPNCSTIQMVVALKPEEALSTLPINANTFIIVATRGHRFDNVALEAAARTPARSRCAATVGWRG